MDDDDSRKCGVTEPMTRLLDGLIDYAGLFPPAALPMSAAVQQYAAYRAGAQRGMLARFVLTADRLEEFVAVASALPEPRGADGTSWPLAVLATGTDAAALDAFDTAHGARWHVDTIEAKAVDLPGIAALAAAYRPRRVVYVEVPVKQDPGALIAALAPLGLRAKIRTGGVTADAFPPPSDVMRFLVACVRYEVPFKATAGLHHPIRGEYALTYAADAPRATMYGFLNLFVAAILLHAGHAAASVAPLLEERDASTIRVRDGSITWRALAADASQVAAARATFAGSFGSCSFEEPVQDLAALSLLPTAR